MSAADFEHARARFVAGNAAFEAGRFEQAEAEFLASLQALPGRPSTLVNLAATRLRLGRPAEALAPLQEALAAQPGDGQAWHHRAVALAELHRHAEALEAFDQALAAGTVNAAVHHRRGLSLVALERPAEAAQAWEQALGCDDRFLPAWVDLGSLLRDLGQRERALQCLERALALGADDPMLRFQVAALRDAQQAPGAPPREYVQRLFDGYAEGFDAHLVGTLGYRTPQLLAEGLATTGVAHFATALDLGCGTGLLAAPLEGWIDRLDGMDLSAAMLEKARALGRYDRLEQGDIAEHLQRTERRYALVLAADVFVYLGALEPVFEGVMRVLEPGGVFAFSVEAADAGEGADGPDPAAEAAAAGPGYVLRTTLRYAHTERYLRTLARSHGLRMCATQRHALRQDHGATIVGLCVWMRRGQPPAAAGQAASQAAV